MQNFISGNIIDINGRAIYSGTVYWENGKITSINKHDDVPAQYILPGFIDAHIHIESSMLTPHEFARIALTHGTVATVSDPHEIANVCGMEGVYYMLDDSRDAKLKFFFGAPSCVPATSFETSGAILDSLKVETLLKDPRIYYLAEMMNYPGVLHGDDEVLKKIAFAKKINKPVDGHAPGLRGNDAARYIAAGISTDHECVSKEEALDKLKYGMKILIREGSAAKNFNALYSLIGEYPNEVMLCSDDKHPDDLIHGHIDELVARAIRNGLNIFDVLTAACINPVNHYKLPVGLLRENDPADFIVVDNPESWKVKQTYINGEKVSENGASFLPHKKHSIINHFHVTEKQESDFVLRTESKTVRVIEALDGQLITNEIQVSSKVLSTGIEEKGELQADLSLLNSSIGNDILKIAVVNRYADAKPAIAFIKNFGLKSGAIASTVAHDSHNIIAVGVTDEDICRAVNMLILHKGGLCVIDGVEEMLLPLPVAGLMSDRDCITTGTAYSGLDKKAKELGCNLKAPFMTLSFMALLVIPTLKLSDKGLFDVNKFQFAGL
ncbi:MAG: adenine deaminase [Bacteroidetes bacterium]|nr:adenine deaminase [Bacteroidota bacterium]